MAEDPWAQVREDLEGLARAMDNVVERAAPLIAEVPMSGSGITDALDPRRGTVRAAQFVSSLNYLANDLRSKASFIKQENDSDA